jgi:protein SCO1/2
LTSVVNKLDLVPGKDYQVVTVSFDHREKFDLAAAKKTSYFGLIEKSIPDSSWKFLTGDSTTIHQLTDAAGFMFKKEGNDFVHPGALILVSPEGKISRYLYGTQYLPFDVKMAIGEASEGRTGPTIIRLLQMCYSYNPEGRTYVFNITRVAGAAILFCAFIFVIVISIKKKSV